MCCEILNDFSVWPPTDLDSTTASCDDTNLSSDNNTTTGPGPGSHNTGTLPLGADTVTKSSQAGSLTFYLKAFVIILPPNPQITLLCSQEIISSWSWAEQPSEEQLGVCLASIITEQSGLMAGAARNTRSAVRLRQRLCVLQRYLTAVSRSTSKSDGDTHRGTHHTSRPLAAQPSLPASPEDKAAVRLARVGSRAALSFAFAFLRRAWRSGEDTDLCSELLQESLDALQALPEASLFYTECVSKVA